MKQEKKLTRTLLYKVGRVLNYFDMKKLILSGLFLIFSIALFVACRKGDNIEVMNPQVEEVANNRAPGGGYCSTSCFWNSCQVHCNTGTPVCRCVGIWYYALGSYAECYCTGGATRGISLNSQNLIHHNYLQNVLLTMSSNEAREARLASISLVDAYQSYPDSLSLLDRRLNQFVDKMEALSQNDVTKIENEWTACSNCDPLR